METKWKQLAEIRAARRANPWVRVKCGGCGEHFTVQKGGGRICPICKQDGLRRCVTPENYILRVFNWNTGDWHLKKTYATLKGAKRAAETTLGRQTEIHGKGVFSAFITDAEYSGFAMRLES